MSSTISIEHFLKYIWKPEMKFAIILPRTYMLNKKEITLEELYKLYEQHDK